MASVSSFENGYGGAFMPEGVGHPDSLELSQSLRNMMSGTREKGGMTAAQENDQKESHVREALAKLFSSFGHLSAAVLSGVTSIVK